MLSFWNNLKITFKYACVYDYKRKKLQNKELFMFEITFSFLNVLFKLFQKDNTQFLDILSI
jgi:hypothetical protein